MKIFFTDFYNSQRETAWFLQSLLQHSRKLLDQKNGLHEREKHSVQSGTYTSYLSCMSYMSSHWSLFLNIQKNGLHEREKHPMQPGKYSSHMCRMSYMSCMSCMSCMSSHTCKLLDQTNGFKAKNIQYNLLFLWNS